MFFGKKEINGYLSKEKSHLFETLPYEINTVISKYTLYQTFACCGHFQSCLILYISHKFKFSLLIG